MLPTQEELDFAEEVAALLCVVAGGCAPRRSTGRWRPRSSARSG